MIPVPTNDGDEMDAFSEYTRRHVGRKAGRRKKIKRKYNKRVRRVLKKLLKEEANDPHSGL